MGHVGVWDGDTTEQRHDDNEEGVEERGDVDGWRQGSKGLTEGDSEELGHQHHGKEVASPVRSSLEARRVVKEHKVDHGRDDAEGISWISWVMAKTVPLYILLESSRINVDRAMMK